MAVKFFNAFRRAAVSVSIVLITLLFEAPSFLLSQAEPQEIEPLSCNLPTISVQPRHALRDPDWRNLDDRKGPRRATYLKLSELSIENLNYFSFTSIAFSPDGQFITSGVKYDTYRKKPSGQTFLGVPVEADSNGWVVVWSNLYAKGKDWIASRLYTSSREINTVAFNRTGREQFLAAGGNDRAFVGVWEKTRWSSRREVKPNQQSTNQLLSVKTIVFSPDGQMLSIGGLQNLTGSKLGIRRWDLRGGELRPPRSALEEIREEQLTGRTRKQEVHAIAFSPDSKIIAAGGRALSLRREQKVSTLENFRPFIHLWNAKTGKYLCGLPNLGSSSIASIAFSPDGTMLASTDSSGTIKLWSIPTLKLLWSVDQQGSTIAFSPSSDLLLSGGKNVKLWQVRTGKLIKTYERNGEGKPLFLNPVIAVAFRPDGQAFAAANQNLIQLFMPSN